MPRDDDDTNFAKGELRALWVGVLVAVPSGAGVALSVLGGNAGSLVNILDNLNLPQFPSWPGRGGNLCLSPPPGSERRILLGAFPSRRGNRGERWHVRAKGLSLLETTVMSMSIAAFHLFWPSVLPLRTILHTQANMNKRL